MNDRHLSEHLHQIGERAIGDDYDRWPVIRRRLTPVAVERSRPLRGRWQPARAWYRLALGSLAVLALVVGLLARGAPAVDAQTILSKAGAASLPFESYHLTTTGTNLDNGGVTTTHEEIWASGPDHLRRDWTLLDAQGAVVSTGSEIDDGDTVWHVAQVGGQTRISKVVGQATQADMFARQTLASLRADLGAKACGVSQRDADTVVAGRDAYVVSVVPDAGSACASKLGRLTVWVDQATFLTLKMEVRDADGTLRSSYEVTGLTLDASVPDSIFSYTPPPGAPVNVYDTHEPAGVPEVPGSRG